MEVVRLPSDRYGEASAVLARAFQNDPAWMWVLPDAKRRAALLPWLFNMGFDITDAEVYANEGELRGVARWLPPGRPVVHVGSMLRALVSTPIRVRDATGRFLSYGRAVENFRAKTVPEPHWYLAGIGVDPAHHRQGIGSSLLEPGIRAAEEEGLPCALLTNSPWNLPFYASHGFKVIRKGHTPDDGPLAWMMLRS